jgi:membrane fusion protein (multidrug efflux system)
MNPDSNFERIRKVRPRRILCLALALGFSAPAIAAAAEPVRVAVAQGLRGDIDRYVALPGTLRANQQVTLQARVAGFVKSVSVDRGDRVAAGQVVAEIEVPELLAERTKQQAEVKVAETEAKRLENGRAKSPDLVTAQGLEAAVGRWEVARAELTKTETLLAYANLAAPFSGTVTARFVDPGAFVPAGAAGGASAVVTLVDTRVLRAQVPVPESEAVWVKVGQPVRINVEGLTNTFQATISRHAASIDETTRSLVVEADLPNPTDTLRPGMSAIVRLGLERHARARLVPTDGVLVEKAGAFVFQVRDGVSRKTAVKLGFQDGPRTEILSGIEDTATIIVPAKSAPADGTAVQIKEAP